MNVTEWTSISVTEEQKADLEAAQEQAGHDGAIGRFLVREVAGDESDSLTTTLEVDAEEVAEKLASQINVPSGEHAEEIADREIEDIQPVIERLDTIASAAKTAEERTGRIEQQLEALQEARV